MAAPSRQLLPDPAVLPAALVARARWLGWRREERNGRVQKVPTDPRTGRRIDHTNPSKLGQFDAVVSAVIRSGLDGVGYSLDPADDLVAVDLDDVIDPVSGMPSAMAAGILDDLFGTYAERSPSGRGLRVLALGTLDPSGRTRATVPGLGWGNTPASLEVYPRTRCQFVTITTDVLEGRAGLLADHSRPLLDLQHSLGRRQSSASFGTASERGFIGDFDALLSRAFRARNGSRIRRLWAGDTAGYASPSEALLALANLLAFWTGSDPGRLFDLMTGSPLVAVTESVRPKWHSRRPHGSWGLVYVAAPAVRDCRHFYRGRTPSGVRSKPPTRGRFSSHTSAGESDNPLFVAWGRVLAGEPAPGYGPPVEEYGKLAALCWHLAKHQPGLLFALDGRAAARLIGVSPATVYRHLKRLQTGDRPSLVRVRMGTRPSRRASEYRWAGRVG